MHGLKVMLHPQVGGCGLYCACNCNRCTMSILALSRALYLLTLLKLALSANEKPVLGYYAESLCPDCMAFSNGPLTKAFSEVRMSLQGD